MINARVVRRSPMIVAASLLVAGCQFSGVNSLDMPGTVGHGQGSFVITVELPNVSSLPQNSPVKVDDVTVGSVSGVEADAARATAPSIAAVELSLTAQVDLPANPVVRVAQTSLLGSQHIELAAARHRTRRRSLDQRRNGFRSAKQPATRPPKKTLSSLGIVVSKGNLGAIQDITDELYAAVVGRAGQFDGLIPRLAELAASVDRQTTDIIAAAEGLNRVARTLADGNDKLARALDALPGALQVLNDNAGNVVDRIRSAQTPLRGGRAGALADQDRRRRRPQGRLSGREGVRRQCRRSRRLAALPPDLPAAGHLPQPGGPR